MAPLTTHLGLMAMTIFAGLAVIVLSQQRRASQSAIAWLLSFVVWPWVAVPLFLLLGVRKDRTFARLDLPPGPAQPTDDTARETLDICTCLIQPDEVGTAFVECLTMRVRKGVRVRLLVDRIGGWRKPSAALRTFRTEGSALQMFPPLRSGLVRNHLNLRMHRKSIIADGTRVLTGGRNIGRDHLGPANDRSTWRDLTVALTGPVMDAHARMFAANWGGPVPPPATRAPVGPALLQLVPSGPARGQPA